MRWSACKSSCSAAFVATNFIVGRCTASAMASASRKSFFCPFEYGRTYFAGMSQASCPSVRTSRLLDGAIDVEDRKVEVGVLRRLQRRFDARGFGGDGVAEFAEHILEQYTDQRLVFHDEHPLDRPRGRFGCHPSPPRAGTGTNPGRI